MAPLIEVLEEKLAALNSLVAAERRRHVLQLAEYHAEATATQQALVRARKSAHRDLSAHRGEGSMVHEMSTPRPKRIRAPREPRKAPAAVWPMRGTGHVTSSSHPFPIALLNLSPPVNINDWAANHGLKRARVRGWYAEPGANSNGARRIPRDWANVIEAELGLPATEETWPNGINPAPDPTAAPYLTAAPKPR